MTTNATDQISEDAAEALTEDDGTRGREAAAGTRLEAALVDATTVLEAPEVRREAGGTTAREAREAIPDAAPGLRGRTVAHPTRVAAVATQDADLWTGNEATE